MAHKIKIALKPAALRHLDELRQKLRDAEETLSAIRTGEVDALVVAGPQGQQQIFTLKGADQPYRVLVETMNEGALTLSEQGVILYCNARMAALLGRPLERMMGRTFTAFLAGDDATAFAKLLREIDGPRKATLKLRSSQGVAPAQLSLMPLDLDGTRAFCAVVTDLTDAFAVRQAILQKDASLRLVAESSPAILFTADARGRIVSIAGAALKSIGGRVDALLNAPSANPRKRASLRALLNKAVNAGEVSHDVAYAGKLWNVNLKRMGIGGVVGIAVDVTGERRAREADEAARRERLQRDFVANVSHEFRTPLSVIQAYAETLQNESLDNKEQTREFLATILRHSAQLSDLVENLLYLSTIDSERLKPKPRAIDVRVLCENLLKDLRPLAERRSVSLKISVPEGTQAFADAAQLRRVLLNVAANGIKYNRSGGSLAISALSSNGKVRLAVADTGIGIKASELPLIFDRFHRSKDARRLAVKGTGLGLAIAKALVESNKGRIWAKSRPGNGTKFGIDLPSRA